MGHQKNKSKEWRENHGKHMSELWNDPEYRARQLPKFLAIPQPKSPRLRTINGYSRKQVEEMWAEVSKQAEEDVEKLAVVEAVDFGTDEDASKEALGKLVAIMRMPLPFETLRKTAVDVLNFTKAKPVIKKDVTVNMAEEWLRSLADDDEPEGEESAD